MPGETRTALENLQKSGASGEQVWKAYTDSQAKFGGMMEQQSANFNGRMSTMKDSITMLVAQAGKPIFDALSSGLGVFNNLLANPAVTTFATNLATATARGLTKFFGGLQSIGTSLSGLLPRITAFGSSIMDAIRPWLPTIQQIGQGIQGALGGAMKTIMPLVTSLAKAFSDAKPQLMGLWGQVIKAIEPLRPLLPIIGAAFGLLATSALAALGGLVGFLKGALPGAIQYAQGVVQVFGGGIKIVSSIVGGVVKTVAALLRGDWSGAWQAAKNMVFGVASGIQTVIGGMGTAISGIVSAFVGGTLGYIRGWASTALATVQGFATAFGGKVETSVNNVIAFFRELPSKIRGFASSISGAATFIGTSILNGIAGALRSGWSLLLRVLREALQSALQGALGALGLGSLGQLFGSNTGGEGSLSVPTGSSNLAPSAANVSSATGGGGAAPVINVTVQGSILSERDFNEAVANGVQGLQRRGRI